MNDVNFDVDLSAAYRLADGVAIRPERFGGLVYRYDNRRLYFIRSHDMTDFVRGLDGHQPLGQAVADFLAGRDEAQTDEETLLKTAGQLASMGLLVATAPAPAPPS